MRHLFLKIQLIVSSLDFQSRKTAPKRDDFGIVNIVRDVTPVRVQEEEEEEQEQQILTTVPPVMETIIEPTIVSPVTTTQLVDEIRK